ncbi:MAG TPA: hypothetical protein PLL75_04040 [Candidatus Omnitrophota bacterium]|nr:hypothetical protein [Candidatus Omnitrophota bacterium]HPS36879.1 hypothetical protein [Candidatus Omnitrophota bacterium]
MNKRDLNQIHGLAIYSMPALKAAVVARAWFVSTKCRHTVRGRGLLRDVREVSE